MVAGVPLVRRGDRIPVPDRSVTILGATGSIGQSTIDVLKRAGRYRVEALAAMRNVQALAHAARELKARFAVIGDPALYSALKEALAGTETAAAAGPSAVVEAAARPADWVMAAIVGAGGLEATLAAIDRGATVALANKECLVCAGALFMERALHTSATVLPVDSEHNAVFQSMSAGPREDVVRVTLTASGGPFRTWTKEAIEKASREQALKHPNWSMGAKVTVDSASLMNKGLELIEAHHLFSLRSDQLDVVVHPQSLVHALVEFRDGSVIAQLGVPDMRTPIAQALAWPDRTESGVDRLDLARIGSLTFERPDHARFPALALARAALEAGGSSANILNAANEVAVAAFLAGELPFGGIPSLVERVLDRAAAAGQTRAAVSIAEVMAIDHNARLMAQALLPEIAAKAS